MAGVVGRTGNPGIRNPKKKNETCFTIEPGKEPKGRMMGFRPPVSLEKQIDTAVVASGQTLSDWLLSAAIAKLTAESRTPYLEKSS
ncbi:hypothetical protein G7B40_015885 [Aetokthonos hydrillicola Thurmond2011]|jgi:hypothetical protein|uniref:Uncharacterized protein n=1 Tax=Aetokthonos hydrillicola Thurmond2011 TaxID=2712845 RepID=A0AAP5I6P9_9CYAN|nr:hypothetical protein [Aetokthonos hydrillicola]MBO3460059.1 hypothetical protein [Aetokthonos hydrillicola CCALA 1050]MBW4589542.1 hypothetical protein [Aetokthonos hydrillicola CCALA 1050]MDR9896033.1 hypothetical protein [Aetokthonos hydrillicola Thurmond2011]